MIRAFRLIMDRRFWGTTGSPGVQEAGGPELRYNINYERRQFVFLYKPELMVRPLHPTGKKGEKNLNH